MIFFTKCGIFLVLCTINYTVKQCIAENASVAFQNKDSDDKDIIKEALLLVELLKSGNHKNILRTIDETVDNATCKPTTSEPLTPYDIETSSSINPETKTEASVTSKPDDQYPQHRRAFMLNRRQMAPWPHQHSLDEQNVDYYRPRGFFRRRFPDYYYFQNYFDYPRVNAGKPLPGFRRFLNDKVEESSSVSPGKTTSKTVLPLTSTTTKFKAKRIELNNTNKSHETRRKSVSEKKQAVSQKFKNKLSKIRRQFRAGTTTKRTVSTMKTTLGTTLKTTTKTKLSLHANVKEIVSEDQTTKDPIKDEIDSELHKELNGTNIIIHRHFKLTEKEKEKKKTEYVRTTLRIHLDGSTRYNIPFPENHAFCFTNPENILCKTP